MKQEMIRIDLDGVNCYLGKEDDNFILFDTGGHLFLDKQFQNRRDAVEKGLQKHGCTAENLKLIVLTHGDNDHVANAAYFRKKYHTSIAMHPGDAHLVEHPNEESFLESLHYQSPAFNLMFKAIKGILKIKVRKILDDFESFKPDILSEDGFDLSPYGFRARIIHTPGHTNGSICILTEQGNLIAGDTFANIDKPTTAQNAYDFDELNDSAEKLKAMRLKTIYPGHGTPFDASRIS